MSPLPGQAEHPHTHPPTLDTQFLVQGYHPHPPFLPSAEAQPRMLAILHPLGVAQQMKQLTANHTQIQFDDLQHMNAKHLQTIQDQILCPETKVFTMEMTIPLSPCVQRPRTTLGIHLFLMTNMTGASGR